MIKHTIREVRPHLTLRAHSIVVKGYHLNGGTTRSSIEKGFVSCHGKHALCDPEEFDTPRVDYVTYVRARRTARLGAIVDGSIPKAEDAQS